MIGTGPRACQRRGPKGADRQTAVDDFAAAFASAPVTIDATYTTPDQSHAMMEPHATTRAWKDDRLTVWTSTRVVDWGRTGVAKTLGMPKENVRLVSPLVGGGLQTSFGAHFVEVAVDAHTAEICVRRMLAVCAAGRILNPKAARSQVIGAMGVGGAIMGELAVDTRCRVPLLGCRRARVRSEVHDALQPRIQLPGWGCDPDQLTREPAPSVQWTEPRRFGQPSLGGEMACRAAGADRRPTC